MIKDSFTEAQKKEYFLDGKCPWCGVFSEFDPLTHPSAQTKMLPPDGMQDEVVCHACQFTIINIFKRDPDSDSAFYALVDIKPGRETLYL